MAKTQLSLGETKVLTYLANQPDRTRLSALSQRDLVVLHDAFSSGCSVADFQNGLKGADKSDPQELIQKFGDLNLLVRGNAKKVYVQTYLNSAPVRLAYPITDGQLEEVRSTWDAGRHQVAVDMLQRAISARMESDGKTRRVVVEAGMLKTVDKTAEILKSMTAELSQTQQSYNISVVEVFGGGYECIVSGQSVRGKNQKHVRASGRIIAGYSTLKKDWSLLSSIPGIEVSSAEESATTGNKK